MRGDVAEGARPRADMESARTGQRTGNGKAIEWMRRIHVDPAPSRPAGAIMEIARTGQLYVDPAPCRAIALAGLLLP